MEILLTGSNGQLGYDFKKLFNKLKIKYIAIDFKELDITNKKSVKEFFDKNKNFSHIINCVGYNDVDRAEIEKEKVKKINIEGVKNLKEKAKEIESVFITYSTDFVFDGEKKEPYIEEDKVNPLSEYGNSKFEAEKEALKYKKTFVIRTSWLFGIGGDNFSKQILNWSKNKKELNIVDDQISSPTYSEDLAYFSWKLIQTKKYGLYHISNNEEASKYDQAKYILEKIKWDGKLKKARTSDFKLLAKRACYSKLSSKKLEKLLGKRIPTWKDALDRYIEKINETEIKS